jgi:diacylglycerol kinase family enzyme
MIDLDGESVGRLPIRFAILPKTAPILAGK